MELALRAGACLCPAGGREVAYLQGRACAKGQRPEAAEHKPPDFCKNSLLNTFCRQMEVLLQPSPCLLQMHEASTKGALTILERSWLAVTLLNLDSLYL